MTVSAENFPSLPSLKKVDPRRISADFTSSEKLLRSTEYIRSKTGFAAFPDSGTAICAKFPSFTTSHISPPDFMRAVPPSGASFEFPAPASAMTTLARASATMPAGNFIKSSLRSSLPETEKTSFPRSTETDIFDGWDSLSSGAHTGGGVSCDRRPRKIPRARRRPPTPRLKTPRREPRRRARIFAGRSREPSSCGRFSAAPSFGKSSRNRARP